MTARRATKGPVERRVLSELKAAGWTASSVGPAATAGAISLDLAQTQDRTRAARDKAALARELRLQLADFRALSTAPKGDVVDEVADDMAGGSAGAADPGAGSDGGSVVRPFGPRRAQAG